MKKVLLIIGLLFFVTCSREKSPLSPSDGNRFGFYFLADSSITLYNISDYSGIELKLADTPWLTANDIKVYNFSTHTIQLKKQLSDIFPEFDDSRQLMQEWNVKPFYVVADGEKIYLAAFHAAYSSLSNIVPYIDLLGADLRKCSVLGLQKAGDDPDMRKDPRVERVLKDLGIYTSGT